MLYSSRQSARVMASTAPLSTAASRAAQRGSWNTNRSRQTLVSMTMRGGVAGRVGGKAGIMWAILVLNDVVNPESYADSAFPRKKSRPGDAFPYPPRHRTRLPRSLRAADRPVARLLAGPAVRADGPVGRAVGAERGPLRFVDEDPG